MKILFLTGVSGSGKTTIGELLAEDKNYNFINSYTDREMRERNETGHIFVDASYMDMLMQRSDIVAKTDIDGSRYCALESQFDDNKINVYVVDTYGINDTIEYFPFADIMSILIRRKKVEVDLVREGRDVCVPTRNDVDFVIDNDNDVQSAANVIKVLVGLDLFNKPSHKVYTINERLDEIYEKERYLQSIKESLLSELWYINYQPYMNLVKFIEEKIKDEFDFNIDIEVDSEPEIHEGYLNFNIILSYGRDEELYWGDIHRMIEKTVYYAQQYCTEHKYDDLLMRLCIFDQMRDD